jgi:hypothetical protein
VPNNALAQALHDNPELLTTGRSPAPRALGDLLIALYKAGATRISLPSCAECGKRIRSLQRRGQDWYCSVCGHRREPCASCGITRAVTFRGREGEARCASCPPEDDRDPVEIAIQVVARIDATVRPEAVARAVRTAVPKAGQRYRLAWALEDHPELLTGAGAQAPTPSVLRLIDELCEAGAQAIIRPACPHCRRVIRLHRSIGGQWLCRTCVARTRAQPCSRCGAVREAATRDDQGRPLCPRCLITDPANQEVCIECDRRRPVAVRTSDGPKCETCRPLKVLNCSLCGRQTPCLISRTTGEPWCLACKQRWVRCAGCDEVRPLRGGTLNEPLCAMCARPEPGFWKELPDVRGAGPYPGRTLRPVHNPPAAARDTR